MEKLLPINMKYFDKKLIKIQYPNISPKDFLLFISSELGMNIDGKIMIIDTN